MTLPHVLRQFSPRDRTAVLIGVLVIPGVILTARGVPAWLRWRQRVREEEAATVQEAAASQRVARTATMLARLLPSVERRFVALAPAVIAGDQPTVAGAHLIGMITTAASGAGVQLGALQVHADSTPQGGLTVIRVSGDGSGDVAGVTRFLATLEGGEPLLSFHALTITPADVHTAMGSPETLHLEFVLDGLAQYDRDDPSDTTSLDATRDETSVRNSRSTRGTQ